MTDMIIKIMVELLSVFALATKNIKQGRFSERYNICIARGSMCHSEVCKEIVVQGEGDRGCSPEVGSIDRG
jgi:hypothetical protein